jgi:hypothetical protein
MHYLQSDRKRVLTRPEPSRLVNSMKKTILALSVCALAAVALPSNTASAMQSMVFESGNDLLQLCSSVGESKGLCMGFMEGVMDTVASYPALQTSLGICFPAIGAITRQQLLDIGRRELLVHPEERHYSAASEVIVALKTAFPCARR